MNLTTGVSNAKRLSALRRGVLALVGLAALGASADAAIVHRWSFNADGAAEDSVGNADGTLHNGAVVSGGQLTLTNAAMAPYVSMPGSGAGGININTFTNVTIEAWYTGPFNTADPPAPIHLNGFRSLVMLGGKSIEPGGTIHTTHANPPGTVTAAEGNGQDYIMIQPWRGSATAGEIRGAITDSNFSTEVGVNRSPELVDGLEHMFTVTVTDTPTGADVRLFIDGVSAGPPASGLVKLSDLSNALAYIGRSLYNDPAIQGTVNEVRIYDMALTDSQVMTDFANGPNGNPVPEPAAVALSIVGLASLMALRRRG